MHPARVHEEYIQVLVNNEPLHLSEQARDPISSSRAVLWLEPTSSSAFLIRGGKAQVSLSDVARGEVAGEDGSARPSFGGIVVDFGRVWLPTTVCALPGPPRKEQMGRQMSGTVRRSSSIAASAISTLGIVADEEENVREYCAAFVSSCLSEALGMATTHHAPRNGGQSNLTFLLLVRALPDSDVLPATVVDLEGPHPAATGPTPSQSHGGKIHLTPMSPPPASLVAAVASILPGALEGELLSRGSVFGLAGLFKFAVKGLRTDQEGDEQKRSLLRGSKADSKGLVVRVHGSTKLRLSPTTRYGPSRVGIDEPSVVLAPLDASAHGCGSDPHRMRMSINGNANEQASKLGGEIYCKGGVGFDVHRSTRKLVSPTAFQGPVVTPSLPAYLAPSTAKWIRNVEQDVGGLRNQVATVVAAVAMTLRRHEGTALTAPASGLLLHGPTGAGKTLLARSVAEHSGAPWFFLDCASVFRRDRGKAERDMQDFLLKASSQSPSVIILDQVESVSKRRPDCAGITELQVYSVLLEMMDRFGQSTLDSPVFFLATSPSSTALDPSLLQRGRLELEVRLGPLDGAARACALGVHARGMRLHVVHDQVDRSTIRSFSSSKMSSGIEAFRAGGRGDADEKECRESPMSQHPQHVVATDDLVAGGRDVLGMAGTLWASLPPTPRTRDEFLRRVAARCHGYLGSDLERLCREAAMRHISSVALVAPSRSKSLTHAWEKLEDPQGQGLHQMHRYSMNSTDNEADGGGVRLQDFGAALDVVRPASLVGNSVGSSWGRPEVPPSAPLVGCDAAMAELRMFILAPLTNPSFLRKLGLRPATGALLHGPHGCGKTSVARALGIEVKGLANFIEVRCSDLVDKVVGRSERAVSDLFAAARAAAPCVLFLDQVEGVAARRGYHSSTEQTFDRILSTLLVEMDGVTSESGGHVVVIAATNDIARLDPAILRPGRLDRRVYLGHPDIAARRAILRQLLIAMPLKTENSGDPKEGGSEITRTCKITNTPDLEKSEMQPLRQGLPELGNTEAYVEWLARQTDGASCAQVTGVCREASLAALREGIGATEVAPRHFQAAFGVRLQR